MLGRCRATNLPSIHCAHSPGALGQADGPLYYKCLSMRSVHSEGRNTTCWPPFGQTQSQTQPGSRP